MGGELNSIRVPHRKHTADTAPERIPVPPVITLPMAMHIGAPAKPVVKAGDHVKVGQLVAEPGGFVSSPIYTGVSGTVKRVGEVLDSMGRYVPAVEIQSDGLQETYEGIAPPEITDLKSMLDAVRMSGVVGLGGAGFPTMVKLSVKDLSQVKAVILNGAECEPYITSDTRTMLDDTDLVWEGIALMRKYMPVPRVIIAIEDNKPACIQKFRALCKGVAGVEVQALKARYPQGGEKVLIYHTTGGVVPEGKLPLDAGAIVVNVTTMKWLAHYAKTGMPLVEKCVTVDGSAVAQPKNLIAPIGTPVRELLEYCGLRCQPGKVLYGGPMMGISMPDTEQPVLKTTNAITAFDEKDARTPAETPCIRCGRCVDRCPLHLMPAEIARAWERKKPEELDTYKVNLCMECGCCAFVCPAHRPLVQINKLAKSMLKVWQLAQKEAGK